MMDISCPESPSLAKMKSLSGSCSNIRYGPDETSAHTRQTRMSLVRFNILFYLQSTFKLTKIKQKPPQANEITDDDQGETCIDFDKLVQDIEALWDQSPKLKADAARVINHCHTLEASLTASRAQTCCLEETNKRLRISLQQQHAEIQNLRKRCIDQEVSLSCFHRAFPMLQADISDLLETWGNIERSQAML